MERRFRVRLNELLKDAEVRLGFLGSVTTRLGPFLQPFVAALQMPEQRTNAKQYVEGLLSDLNGKDCESIAYLHDRERQGLQKFIGQSPWDYRPLMAELVRQVAAELGEEDGVLVFDPSAFPKKGTESVGVKRQWCGRLGKIENCQVGIYLGYVSRVEHALVDFRLYLPEDWAQRKRRRQKAGVPAEIRFRTRHELILDMLEERASTLPHAWISGDDELGRSSWFRRELQGRNERYLLAVPANTLIRDLKGPLPEPAARRSKTKLWPFTRVDRWCAGVPAKAWQTIEVRPGEKGPITVQATWTLVQARTEGKPSESVEMLVVFREKQADGTWKHDYLLSNAPFDTPLKEFARVFKAQHCIEECLQRAKSEAGLADYQVRTWEGWHHHQTLALLATWFLTQETRRGKNTDTCAHRTASASADRRHAQPPAQMLRASASSPYSESPFAPQRRSAAQSLVESQTLTTPAV